MIFLSCLSKLCVNLGESLATTSFFIIIIISLMLQALSLAP